MNPDQAKQLRAPFPKEQIGKLPKGGTQLDYVGHAAVTDRLLEVDPDWSWEPVAWAEDGGPLIRHTGKEASLWIRLTVCGVTRLGVGICPAAAFELEKQLISDALRNAAMRFGVALDLWSRQPLLDDTFGPDPGPAPKARQPRRKPAAADAEPADVIPIDRDLLDRTKARIEQLVGDDRTVVLEWKAQKAFTWPWSREVCQEINDRIDVQIGLADDMEAPF